MTTQLMRGLKRLDRTIRPLGQAHSCGTAITLYSRARLTKGNGDTDISSSSLLTFSSHRSVLPSVRFFSSLRLVQLVCVLSSISSLLSFCHRRWSTIDSISFRLSCSLYSALDNQIHLARPPLHFWSTHATSDPVACTSRAGDCRGTC